MATDAIRVLHLTDPHLFADANGSLRGMVTEASLGRVLAHYFNSDWQAHRTLVTGDLIQDDSAAAYDRFRELLLPLNMRTHCVPGNHDVRELMRKVCCAPPFSYCAYEEVGDWLIVGIDSCVEDTAGGEVSAAEYERLSDIVIGSQAKHVMVNLHHPPVTLGSAWLDSVGLKNSGKFLERLRTLGRVRLAVFGHAHQAYDDVHEGIRVLGSPSTCRQFLPGSDEFAVDERPPAYRRITLYTDGSIDTDVVWVDE